MDVDSPLNIVINGKAHAINVSNVDTLLTVLRDDLGVKTVRGGCAVSYTHLTLPTKWIV